MSFEKIKNFFTEGVKSREEIEGAVEKAALKGNIDTILANYEKSEAGLRDLDSLYNGLAAEYAKYAKEPEKYTYELNKLKLQTDSLLIARNELDREVQKAAA